MTPLQELEDALFDTVWTLDVEAMDRLLLALAEHDDPYARALEARYRGLLANNFKRYDEALPFYQDALRQFEMIGDQRKIATVAMDISIVLGHLGDQPGKRATLQRALDLFTQIGDRSGSLKARLNLATDVDESGDLQGALAMYRSLLSEIDGTDMIMRARLLQNIAAVESDLAMYQDSLEHGRQALEAYESIRDPDGVLDTLLMIGHIFTTNGEYPIALEYFNRGVDVCEASNYHVGKAAALEACARVYNSVGDLDTADEHLRTALSMLDAKSNISAMQRIRRNLAINMRSQQRVEEALPIFEDLAVWHQEQMAAHSYNDAIYHAVQCLVSLGRVAEARSRFESRKRDADSNVWTRLTRMYAEAVLLDAEGAYDEANAIALDALELSRSHAIHDPEGQVLELLMKIDHHRNDFAAYVQHAGDAKTVSERLRGHGTSNRLALIAKEREMRAEREQRERERELLYGALPRSIADRMLRGEHVTGDHFDHAAVLFIDVVAFTMHTAEMHPSAVVMLLDQIFNAIDAICTAHDVIKIKTIGDSYMCFRGDADASTNALSIARVALDVMHAAFMWPNGETIRFRAGIHIGPATAGVIGSQRLQYDVWGDTVNVASRMESTGEPGRIHVSDAFAQHLAAAALTLIPRGLVDIKGKGAMQTYWLA